MSTAATASTTPVPSNVVTTLPVAPRKRAEVKGQVAKAAAAITSIIAAAPNAHSEKAPVKVEARVEQGLVDAYLKAEAGVGDAAVALLYACLHAKVHSSQFGNSPSAKVRASEFNTAYKAMRLLTLKGAKAVMDDASKRKGERRSNIIKALREAIAVGSQVKGSALRAADLSKAVAKRIADREAKKAAQTNTRAPRTPLPKSNSPEAVVPVMLAAFMDAEKQLGKVEWKPSQTGKAKDLMEQVSEIIASLQAMA